ncbi:MAG: thioredoxin family protein [Catenulispora sp.]|nr:thioredoxin family protein [Catenulispora sp.]
MDPTGLLAAGGVLVAASGFGLWRKRTDGAVRETRSADTAADTAGGGDIQRLTPADLGLESDGGSDTGRSAGAGTTVKGGGAIAADRFGLDAAGLHPRATLVQFSSKVCQYCGPTRRLLTELADRHAVSFVEIDAEDRLDLARRLSVLRTPTVLLLDPEGRITHRVSGPPRRAELSAAVSRLAGDPISAVRES